MNVQLLEARYMNIKQASVYTGLSGKTLYKWAEERKIPAHKVGRLWRFDKHELDDFIHNDGSIGLVNSFDAVDLGGRR